MVLMMVVCGSPSLIKSEVKLIWLLNGERVVECLLVVGSRSVYEILCITIEGKWKDIQNQLCCAVADILSEPICLKTPHRSLTQWWHLVGTTVSFLWLLMG